MYNAKNDQGIYIIIILTRYMMKNDQHKLGNVKITIDNMCSGIHVFSISFI